MKTSVSGVESLVRQLVHYGFGIGGPAIISAFSTAIFTRRLSTEAFGEYTVTLALTTLGISVLGQWLQQPLGRYVSVTDHVDSLKWIRGAAFGLISISAISILALITHKFFFSFSSDIFFPASVFLILQIWLAASTTILQAKMLTRFYSIQQNTIAVSRLLFCYALIYVCPSAASLMWGSVFATLIALVPSIYKTKLLASTLHVLKRSSAAQLLIMSKYGLPMTLWFLASSSLANTDRIIMGLLDEKAAAGIYSANFNLMNGTVGLIAAPILSATWPLLMRAWNEGNVNAAGEWLGKIASRVLSAGLCLVGLLFLVADDLAALLLGPGFREGAKIMPIVVAGMVAFSVATYANKPFEFRANLRPMILMGVCIATFSVLLNYLLLPHYGYIAAAWISLGCYSAYTVFATIIGRRFVPWKWEKRVIVSTSLSVLVAYNLSHCAANFIQLSIPVYRLGLGFGLFSAFLLIAMLSAYPRFAMKLVNRLAQPRHT